MEQNTGQQRLKQSNRSSTKQSLQYIRKIQVENLEQSLYFCLVQLHRTKVQLLQEYNRQFSRKSEIELEVQRLAKNSQKERMLKQFERQYYEKSKAQMKGFIFCGEFQSAGVLKTHRELVQRFKEFQEKQKNRKQQLRSKEKQLERQKEFRAKLQKDIQIIENKIEKGESETFEQEKALYQNKIQELQSKFEQEHNNSLSNSKKLDQLKELKQLNRELNIQYNKARKRMQSELGIVIQYDSDPEIAEKLCRIMQDAKIKQSIRGQLIHFIQKGVNLKQENQILKEFLQLTQDLQNRKKT